MAEQPSLRVAIELADSQDGHNIRVPFPAGSARSEKIALGVFILNESDVRVDYAAFGLLFDQHLGVNSLPPVKGLISEVPTTRDVKGIQRGEIVIPVDEYIVHWCLGEHLPIFREYRQPLFPRPLQIIADVQQTDTLIAWWVVAPGVAMRTGYSMLGHRGDSRAVAQGSVGEVWLDERGELPQGALEA